MVALGAGTVRVFVTRHPRNRGWIAETYLLYLLVLYVGLGGVMGFLGHTVRAAKTAGYIGWPAGNPFQSEVAVANLAFGILGLLCLCVRGHFWTATAVGVSVFLLGAGVVHLYDMRVTRNVAAGNAGVILFLDFILPVALLGLLCFRGTSSGR